MSLDPVETNPENYRVLFENDRVRVLEYHDVPGTRTRAHRHPDSVMYTVSSFSRRLSLGEVQRDVELVEGTVAWLDAQEHHGENIGDTDTRALFIELKDPAPVRSTADGALGPS